MNGCAVSIMMPVFNSRGSLPWALSSVIAQTYEDWELVIVDDGSSDHPEEVIGYCNDSRIRVIQLSENKGRGFARQVAQESCRGEFVCMLDADDWMYPGRVEKQVSLMRANRAIALVSSGLGVLGDDQHLVGCRATGADAVSPPFDGIDLPFAYPSSMYRMNSVNGVRYNADMIRTEDWNFLVNMLKGERYIVMSDILYAYSESFGDAMRRTALGYRYYRKHLYSLDLDGYSLAKSIAKAYVKQQGCNLTSWVGMDRYVLSRRNRLPTSDEIRRHEAARSTVLQTAHAIFGAEYAGK